MVITIAAGIYVVRDRFRLPCQRHGLRVRLAIRPVVPALPGGSQPFGAVVQVLYQPAQLARLMADLGQEGRLPNWAIDLLARHGAVQGGYKNARYRAGIGEDLQQLLLGDLLRLLLQNALSSDSIAAFLNGYFSSHGE